MTLLPKDTPEYVAARKPFLDRLKSELAPHWERCRAGEITHAQYRELVTPHIRSYCKNPEFHAIWVKHGGTEAVWARAF